MALFGKLFEKKACSVCGGEIGMLGNRKLADGNLCKACANKLSPWFEDRRESTVAQIEEQLAYREANKEKVAAFNITRTLGNYTKVLLDEDAGVFMVTSEQNLEEANPDVLAFTDVTGCEFKIDEREDEIKYRDNEGNYRSYNPPRYRYSYDFHIIIQVRNPYFDDICFDLNTFSVDINPYRGMPEGPSANRVGSMGRMMGSMMSRGSFNPETDPDYRKFLTMGEEIKEALMTNRKQARDGMAAAAAPKMATTCPWCGATTTPDASGRCEYCGGSVNG